jgi:hypothetical protein
MLLMGARFAEFCGWLFQDLGSPERALALTDMAMEYAQEIGDIRLTSYLCPARPTLWEKTASLATRLASLTLRFVASMHSRLSYAPSPSVRKHEPLQ